MSREHLALAHNGNLINATELRKDLEYTGAIFQTTIDSEVIAYHIARERLNASTVEEAVCRACKKIKGAYSLSRYESAQTDRCEGSIRI